MNLKPADTIHAYCIQRGYPPPLFEFPFHVTRKWRWDCAWPVQMWAMEFHGGVWSYGRHTRGKGFINDREKMNEAQLMGWRVLEIPLDWFKSGEVYTLIDRIFGETK